MTHSTFLSQIVADPDNQSLREMYADFLEEQFDSRAEYLRLPRPQERFSFIDWIASQNEPDVNYYVETFPELSSAATTWRSEAELRQRIKDLQEGSDSKWVAFMNSVGNPFRPTVLWNNTGPVCISNEEMPFANVLGRRGGLLTFSDSFRTADSWFDELMADLRWLMGFVLGDCAFGAASCPIHPFACEIPAGVNVRTAEGVLAALHVTDFRSEHISSLDEAELCWPDYQPATVNDEIHNDFAGQKLFPTDCVNEEIRQQYLEWGIDPDVPELLRNHVADGKLWYLLLHCWTGADSGRTKGQWVVLLAVGQSSDGRRLVGVISNQMCHNQCDWKTRPFRNWGSREFPNLMPDV